jgi:class 3 adenylate cyclase
MGPRFRRTRRYSDPGRPNLGAVDWLRSEDQTVPSIVSGGPNSRVAVGGSLTGERVERRLAAILEADVTGYSRLMGRDEAGTLYGLRSHRRELIDPKIAEYRGRVVKTTGDAFSSNSRASLRPWLCAVEVQKGMVGRNAATPRDGVGGKKKFAVIKIIFDC